MPKLPGVPEYGMGGAPQATLAPSPEGIAGPVQRSVGIAMQQAQIPNPLLQIADTLTPKLAEWQQREQDKEDALARSQARTAYFTSADQQFLSAQDGIDNKDSFDALQKSLAELKQNTIANYRGSDNGRAALAAQLEEYHNDYTRRAIVARSQAIRDHFDNEVTSTTNRLSGKVYELPHTMSDQLRAADAYLADAAPGMSKDAIEKNRAQMHNTIAYSAIDGLLNRGDFEGAKELSTKVGQGTLTPVQQGSIDRRVLELQQHLTGGGGDLKAGPDGVLFNSKTGAMTVPPPEVQQYLMGLKSAGKTDTNVVVNNAGQTEFVKERSRAFATSLNQLQSEAQSAQDAAAQALEVDKLLQGVPTGTWSADMQYQLQKQFGFNKEQVASREAAQAAQNTFALTKAQSMKGSLSDKDIAFVSKIGASDLQTPLGRAQTVYILQRAGENSKRIADAAARIGDAVASGEMTEGNARMALAEVRKHILDESAKTFSPPSSIATSSPEMGSAPVEPAGKGVTKKWKLVNGQLVPE